MSIASPQVEELFLRALEQPDAALRQADLDREYGGSPELRAEVERLLVFHAAAERFFLKAESQMNQVLSDAPETGD
jgi:hypothetical protein